MNTTYLNSLPEVENRFKAILEEGEKPVFTAIMPIVGDQRGQMIGTEMKVTLTNQRIIMNSGVSLLTFSVTDDFTSFARVDYKKLFLKGYYYEIKLNKTFSYNNVAINAIQFYFSKKGTEIETQFADILIKADMDSTQE